MLTRDESALMQDKSVVNASSLLNRSVSGLPLPSFVTNMIAPKFAEMIKKRKFLFGDQVTSVSVFGVDCSVFGQLAVTYFLPYRQYISDLLDDDFPRVKNYLERIRTHYFQDWKIE
uniref:GST_C_6 domain-containing protein n=1 Tax=Heterorhabditis bacteriophora TaxID=37862 RepID=A0A1I7WZX6_HETBA